MYTETITYFEKKKPNFYINFSLPFYRIIYIYCSYHLQKLPGRNDFFGMSTISAHSCKTWFILSLKYKR